MLTKSHDTIEYLKKKKKIKIVFENVCQYTWLWYIPTCDIVINYLVVLVSTSGALLDKIIIVIRK